MFRNYLNTYFFLSINGFNFVVKFGLNLSLFLLLLLSLVCEKISSEFFCGCKGSKY